MPEEPIRKQAQRKSPFLNEGIRLAHERLKKILQDPQKRRMLAKKILTCKKEDNQKSYPQHRGAGAGKKFGAKPIEDYYAFYRTNREKHDSLLDITRAELEKKQKLRVLDVGAGWGQALDELKEEFGDRVETHALVLKATPELLGTQKQRGRIDQIHQVAIETFLPKQEYDLIVSFFGGMVYSAHPDIAIQKIAHSLSVGGVAYLHLSEFEAFNIKYKRPLELGPNFLADIDSYYETVVIRRLR